MFRSEARIPIPVSATENLSSTSSPTRRTTRMVTACVRKLDRVARQVEEDLAQPDPVGDYPQRSGPVDLEGHVVVRVVQ
jgi:hypothetical protein